MNTLTFGSLFTGIGGFDLGFERTGMTCAWQVENDPNCNRVLSKHWPTIHRHRDIRDCGKHNLSPVDIICGGFPCQPFSHAGPTGRARQHESDDRNLWPEMRRIVEEVAPAWVVAENVAHIERLYLDVVLRDLETLGYNTVALRLPAGALGVPQIRKRVLIVAYADKERPNHSQFQDTFTGFPRAEAEVQWLRSVWVYRRGSRGVRAIPDPRICRAFDEFSPRMDRNRFAMIGNAFPPIMAQVIAEAILATYRP